MINITSEQKMILLVILNLVAYTLGFFSYVIPLHKYEWSNEPGMQKFVDADTALAILLFSVLGLICSVLAFVISLAGIRHKHNNVGDFILLSVSTVALIFCGYRLIEVIPFYSG